MANLSNLLASDFRGYTGSQGTTGFTGSIGGTGFTGSVGFTGSQGTTGFTGSIGATGFTGSIGATGFSGSRGFTGSIGATGFTGSIGFTGSQGATGFTGSIGATGFTGSLGFTGSQGATGFTGSIGATGFSGSRGFTGSIGFTGSQGPSTIPDWITHEGDTDTRFGFPTTDTFAIETAGTEKLRVTSTGFVGIYTNNPQANLDVSGTIRVSPDVLGTLQVGRYSAGYAGAAIDFRGTPTFTSFQFEGVEKMRLTNDSRLGVGTTDPQANLHVSGPFTGSTIRLQSTSGAQTTFNGTGAGIELTTVEMNATNKYTPAIKFGSTDSAFTTTNPKFGAAIIAEATEVYAGDTDSGMSLSFWTSPDNAGTGHGVTERFRIANTGAWGLSGANYGTSGQVLTSNGTGSAPTWQTAGAPGSSDLATIRKIVSLRI